MDGLWKCWRDGDELRWRGVGGERARATGGGNEGAMGRSVMARPAPRPSRAGSGVVEKGWSMAKSREGGVVVMTEVGLGTDGALLQRGAIGGRQERKARRQEGEMTAGEAGEN